MAFRSEDGGWIKSWVDRGPFGLNIGSPQGAEAEGNALAAAMGALGNFATSATVPYAAYAQGMGNMYGANAGALGNAATARANFGGAMASANAQAEAARQIALGNIGSSALGAYGSASNSAMGAWAQNQQAYNRSLADMYMSNQNAMGQMGTSRNNALAGLGGAYAASNIAGQLGGGGGFQATGPGGRVASGSYSQPQSSGQPQPGGIDSIRDSLNDPGYLMALREQMESGANRLDNQHYSSRGMPSEMLGQTLSGLLALGRQGYEQSRGGMDQFYRNRPTYNDSDIVGDINRNFDSARGDMTTGLSGAQGALRGLFDSSLGNLPFLQSPLQKAQQAREAELLTRRNGILDQIAQRQEYTQRDGTGQPVRDGRRASTVTGDTHSPFWSQDHYRQRLRFEDELYR